MAKNISREIKAKTDAQLRLLEQENKTIIKQTPTGEVYPVTPAEYQQSMAAGKNITITTSGNIKTINAVMNLLAGSNITISEPDAEGKVTITGTIKGKEIDIGSFIGKDGYILTYDETADKFILAEATASYTLPQATETTLGGIKAKVKTTETSEIAIDPTTGKLYGPAPDEATNGIPAGGSAGQILAKIDGTDYNTQWIDPPIGGGYGGFAIFSYDETSILQSEVGT